MLKIPCFAVSVPIDSIGFCNFNAIGQTLEILCTHFVSPLLEIMHFAVRQIKNSRLGQNLQVHPRIAQNRITLHQTELENASTSVSLQYQSYDVGEQAAESQVLTSDFNKAYVHNFWTYSEHGIIIFIVYCKFYIISSHATGATEHHSWSQHTKQLFWTFKKLFTAINYVCRRYLRYYIQDWDQTSEFCNEKQS